MLKVIVVSALMAGAAFAQSANAVWGIVSDESGRPVAGAKVYYNNIRAFKRDSMGRPQPAGALISGETRTRGDGTFEIRGLADGNYRLCVEPGRPDLLLLPTCTWGGDLPTVSIGANVPVRLRTAVPVTVHVEDPQGRLRSNAFAVSLIRDDGEFETAELHSNAQNGRSFRVAVPPGARLELLVDTDLRVADTAGRPVPARVPSLAIHTLDAVELRLRIVD